MDAESLEQLAKLFCTIEEIAGFFNVSARTVIRRLKLEPWKGAYERGQRLGKISVRRLQWRHAQGQGSSAVHMTIWMSRNHLGETDRAPGEVRGPNGAAISPAAGDVPTRVVIEGGLPEPGALPAELPPPDLPTPLAAKPAGAVENTGLPPGEDGLA